MTCVKQSISERETLPSSAACERRRSVNSARPSHTPGSATFRPAEGKPAMRESATSAENRDLTTSTTVQTMKVAPDRRDFQTQSQSSPRPDTKKFPDAPVGSAASGSNSGVLLPARWRPSRSLRARPVVASRISQPASTPTNSVSLNLNKNLFLNEEQRGRLFDALLGDVGVLEPGSTARRQLEQCALEQLNDVEPVVVAIILEIAEKAWRP